MFLIVKVMSKITIYQRTSKYIQSMNEKINEVSTEIVLLLQRLNETVTDRHRTAYTAYSRQRILHRNVLYNFFTSREKNNAFYFVYQPKVETY